MVRIPKGYWVDATSSQYQGPLFEPSSEQICIPTSLPPVFLDQMLENHGTTGVFRDTNPLLRVSFSNFCLIISLKLTRYLYPGTWPWRYATEKVHLSRSLHVLTISSFQVISSSLAFFSERRIQSLSQQLGNDRLNQLVETIESIIRSRLLAQGPSSSPISFKYPSDIEQVSLDKIRLYTDCELIHSCLLLSSHCWQTVLGNLCSLLQPTAPNVSVSGSSCFRG